MEKGVFKEDLDRGEKVSDGGGGGGEDVVVEQGSHRLGFEQEERLASASASASANVSARE